ncbi:Aste57867_20003 [Aphanomyces stellatus]|uniref:Aste57867_20003 protein n=1 Tax=Aphanomyces stellatus TaxID=120398 RepID=A0A485LEJ6_9STRA|nr:hypothetical protein As57867_019937 [Aphanomyces stellatus]VFT96700.1 Aste57867_20003 [Aphanomyces stellatus]
MQHGGAGSSAAQSSALNQSSPSHVHVQASELSGPVHGVLLRIGDTHILLNCGDVSPTTSTPITSFTALGIPPGTIISAILITDWRVSSAGMLPSLLSAYNNHHNRNRGKDKLKPPAVPPPTIFLTHTTRALMPHILKECKGKDAPSVSFLNDTALSTVITVACGQPHVHVVGGGVAAAQASPNKLTVTAHRAGHVAGGCFFAIEMDGIHITFVDGFNLNGSRILLPTEVPTRPPHLAILNSAYVVEVSETRTVLEREFCKEIHDTVVSKGKVIIPVFGVGCFFHDMLALLQDYWVRMRFAHVPMYVTSESLLGMSPLLADSFYPSFHDERTTTIPLTKLPDLKLLQEPQRPMVVFTAGASISTGDTAHVLQACGGQPDNLLVLSEFRTRGTVNHAFLNNIACSELSKSFVDSILCRLHTFPCGDEVDAREVVELARQCRPTDALLLRGGDAADPFLLDALAAVVPPLSPITALKDDDVWTAAIPRELTVRLRANLATQGGVIPFLVLAEPRKTLYFNNESSGVRRLKKKRHALAFGHTWKCPKGPPRNQPKEHKRRHKSAGFGLSMLLSNEASSGDDDDEAAEADANVADVLDTITAALHQWLGIEAATSSVVVERHGQWLRVASVEVSVSPDWSLTMNWAFDDEELASRISGLAQRVVEAQYREAQAHN